MADLREQLERGLTDHYRIERELGRGGMAVVYLAQDLRHDRSVALKGLQPAETPASTPVKHVTRQGAAPAMANRMHAGIAALLVLALGVAAPLAAQKQCHKGIQCGNSCISAAKTCHVGTAAAAPAGSASESTPSVNRPRDERGRFIRSRSAKARFERLSGHPNGWAGHVVDHIIPLACGGPDTPENMQWQTIEVAKAKDRVETRGCVRR